MRPLCLVVTICCVLGCTSDSVPGLIKEHRPAVERTFDAIRAVKLPPAGSEAPPVPLVLQRAANDAVNAMFIYQEDLAKPGSAAEVPLRTMDSLPLVQCGSLLDTEKLYPGAPQVRLTQATLTPTIARAYLSGCTRLRYVLVIQGKAFKPPEVGEAKFVPGLYRAEVVAIDLTTGKSVGSYQVDAANKEDVTVVAGEDRQQRVLRDLEGAIYTALREGARTTFPGSLPPPAI